MKLLDSMINKFDAVVLLTTTDDDLNHRLGEFNKDKTASKIYEAYDSIDAKATAILQHVSIMIAVTSLLFSLAAYPILKVTFVCELLFYIVLALTCLRLFMTQHMSPKFHETKNVVAKEAVLDLTGKFTFLVSIGLILTIVAEVTVNIFEASPK
jgi:hypothetical protein